MVGPARPGSNDQVKPTPLSFLSEALIGSGKRQRRSRMLPSRRRSVGLDLYSESGLRWNALGRSERAPPPENDSFPSPQQSY